MIVFANKANLQRLVYIITKSDETISVLLANQAWHKNDKI
jgi:hypothetical protein